MKSSSAAELIEISKMHVTILTTSVTAKLGLKVTQSFYEFAIKSEQEFVATLKNDAGKINSVALVSYSPNSLNRRMVYYWKLLFFILINLYKLPFSQFLSPGRTQEEKAPELMYFFVDAGQRSVGLGTKLLLQVEDHLRQDGLPHYYVKTEKDETNRALKFYLKNGFIEVGESHLYGQEYVVLKKELVAV